MKDEDIQEILQKTVYDPLEKIIVETKLPSIRPELEKIFLDRIKLQAEITGTQDLDAVSKKLIERARQLENDVSHYKEILLTRTELEKTERRGDFLSRKQKALSKNESLLNNISGIDRADENRWEGMKDFFATMEKFYAVVDDVNESINTTKYGPLEKRIWSFNKKRIAFKIWRQLERFLVSVFVFGVLMGSLVSQSAAVFFEANSFWILLVVLVWNIIKEYRLGPYLRNRRLQKQRSDLYSFLTNITSTEVDLIIRRASDKVM